MTVTKWFIVLFLLGMFAFTWLAEFGTPFWDGLWAIWQNICYGSVLSWWSIYENSRGEMRKIVKPVAIYSTCLLGWELSSLLTGLSIDNTVAVALFFGATAIVIGYVSLWRETRLNKFLSKHLHL
jgi:hypothetical protein